MKLTSVLNIILLFNESIVNKLKKIILIHGNINNGEFSQFVKKGVLEL